MKITAKVIEDSIHAGVRLTTLQLEYPRFIHAEFMTHRVFSRNASSSRAIPVKKLINMALEDPAFFAEVGENEPGMQATRLVSEETREKFQEEWEELAEIVAEYARRWALEYNIHKQVVNRVMEPWHHIKVVVTSTEWDNFFSLRDHPDAQPEIRALAIRMKEVLAASTPIERNYHLPYVSDTERRENGLYDCLRISTARCARVSYMKHDGSLSTIEEDIELHDSLVSEEPIHASPAEHPARALENVWNTYGMASNFSFPWVQYRRFVERGGG